MNEQRVAKELVRLARGLVSSGADWQETKAGYEHRKTGWRVELIGPRGMWYILTDKGKTLTKQPKSGDKVRKKYRLRYKTPESAFQEAEEIMRSRELL